MIIGETTDLELGGFFYKQNITTFGALVKWQFGTLESTLTSRPLIHITTFGALVKWQFGTLGSALASRPLIQGHMLRKLIFQTILNESDVKVYRVSLAAN